MSIVSVWNLLLELMHAGVSDERSSLARLERLIPADCHPFVDGICA